MNNIELDKEREKLRNAGCGWINGTYYKGTPKQALRYKELDCINMINSILAYHCNGCIFAKDVVEYEKNSPHNYLENYIKELGEDRVIELIQAQIDSIDYVSKDVYCDNEGVSYNSINWK